MSGGTTVASYGTDWLYLAVPVLGWLALATWAVRRGTGRSLLVRYGDGLGSVTGLPAWAATGYVSTVASLLVGALGFYWDVAWHVDLGRDEFVFTPGHTAILLGLGGIALSAFATIAVATLTDADVALKWRHWRAPWGAIPLLACGVGAVLGFPIDDFWHRAYGVDVTMWGPTHILMIGGGSLAPLALLALVREAGPGTRPRLARRVTAVMAAATLIGLSTFQLEFDLGVSQWQMLYHPVLVAIAGGLALTLARLVIGPFGALFAAFFFVQQRVIVALLVGGALNLTTPRFALYVGSAIVVEIVMHLTRNRPALVRAVATGLGVGTVGLATEWAWVDTVGRIGWRGAMFPKVLLAVVAAVAAAVIGMAAGSALLGRRRAIPGAALALAFGTIVVALVVPSPRRAPAPPATATLETAPAGPGRVHLDVTIDPASVVDTPDAFMAFSWQGGSSEVTPLRRVDADTWRATRPVPVGGSWKTLVRLIQGPVLAGAPVYLPADEQIGASLVPVEARRTVPLTRDTSYLMREARAGAAWPAVVAYTMVGIIALSWITTLLLAYRGLARRPRRTPLSGARVVVTGALGGIGQEVVRAYRNAGASVAGIDLVAADGVLAADVRSPESAVAAVREAAERLGGIDVLINLAGIGRAQDAGDLPDDEARRTVDINFWGTWHATAAAVPWLVESRGHVVVTASGLAVATVPWAAAYAASKRAVSAYADTLRAEYRGRFTVTVVNPGYIRTPIHDVAAAAGASLEGVVPADPMESVVRAYLRAVVDRPRSLSTSLLTTVALWGAGRNPRLADLVTAYRMKRLNRPDPAFRLTEDELARRRTPEPAQARR